MNLSDKQNKTILETYWFLTCEVDDYTRGLYGGTNEQFIDELRDIIKQLELNIPACDPEKMHGNHL